MTRSLKIILTIFVLAAAGLYFVLYGLPELRDVKAETVILEPEHFSITDKQALLVIRNETLYLADSGGELNYINENGTKVRSGVSLLSIEASELPESADVGDLEAFQSILERAGDSVSANPGNIAPYSALVSYYGDGYEKILTPETLDSLTWQDSKEIPANPVSLRRLYTRPGDPLYKLTDNNLWYLVFWIAEDEGARVRYEEGRKVTLRVSDSEIAATVQSITVEENVFKVVLRSDMYYKDMTRYRRLDAEILFSERRGIVVDGSWIVAKEQRPGIYIKQKDGSFKWIPVRVRETSGNRYLIYSGLYYEDGVAVQSVNYYDEALANPSEYMSAEAG
jgi:putative membrane fusion protein